MGGSHGRDSGGLNSVRPSFQSASARLESLWKQTAEMRERGREMTQEHRDSKKQETEKEKKVKEIRAERLKEKQEKTELEWESTP